MLISNSKCPGQEYLGHCAEAIRAFLGDIKDVTFIPFAAARNDWGMYAMKVAETLAMIGIKSRGINEVNPAHQDRIIAESEAIFVGGGNTFRLLKNLCDRRLMGMIRDRVDTGIPYLGASAGANIAGPTIMTTNDMPIIYPPSFNALALVPFQINPHFIERDPNSAPGAETREERIAEYHQENDTHVIGLREGSWIIVKQGVVTFHGPSAKYFGGGMSLPKEWSHPLGLW